MIKHRKWGWLGYTRDVSKVSYTIFLNLRNNFYLGVVEAIKNAPIPTFTTRTITRQQTWRLHLLLPPTSTASRYYEVLKNLRRTIQNQKGAH